MDSSASSLRARLRKRGTWLSARLAHGVERARDVLKRSAQGAVPAPVAMLELLSGAWLSQAVVAAAELGLGDAIRSTPRSADEVAQQLGLSVDGTRRLLRALAQHGVFTLEPGGRFSASPLSRTLARDDPSSIRDFALFIGCQQHREHWSALTRSVEHGESWIAHLRGQSFFEHARSDPAFGALFGAAMSNLSRLSFDFLQGAYDFSRFQSLVDVGGGEGRFLRAVLESTPNLRGVLFDLPEVVARAERSAHAPLCSRLSYQAGSFFDPLPRGHDAYLLKHVLHDWDDDPARRILLGAREALAHRPEGRVIAIEMVLPDDSTPHVGKLFDLEMLLSVGGRERTHVELERLFASAGLVLTEVIATATPLSILEARLALR